MPQATDISNDHRRFLLRFPFRYWKGWLLIFVITAGATAFNLLQPWPMKVLVDNVFDTKPLDPYAAQVFSFLPGTSGPYGMLFWVAFAGLLIFVVNSALDVVLTFAWIKVGQKMVYDLMARVFSRVQRRSLIFHSRSSVGDLMNRVTGDAWSVHTLADALMFAPAHALLLTVAMILIMARMDVTLTVAALITAPIVGLGSRLFGKRMRMAHRHKKESESRIQSHLQQTLSGIVVVQAFGQEERERGRFREFADAVIGAQKRSTLTGSIYGLFSGGLNSLGTGLILYLGARAVLSQELTTGGLLVFMSYVGTLQSQLKVFTDSYGKWQEAAAGIDRLSEVLGADEETPDTGGRQLGRASGHVRFVDVSFGYSAETPVLRNVSLEVKAGQMIAIVGRTGAGKSTLVSMLPRFYSPSTGRIEIDGNDIAGVSIQSLRENIALVSQESILFPISIAENISFGRPGASHKEIEAAARAANAHDFITSTPDGYDTIVGERGASLSGGERQRISIARALLKDAPILILDEPTSALDARTERSLLDAIEKLMEGRTTFVIAHRLSTILRADNILVMEGGEIVEQGMHEELVDRGGVYAELYQKQFAREQLKKVA